jgi:hypothetical protein
VSTIETPDSLKMVREALCVAQAWLPTVHDGGEALAAIEVLGRLIEDIDRQRPLGPDGKHDDRHTPTCGCEDVDTFEVHTSQSDQPIMVTHYRRPSRDE